MKRIFLTSGLVLCMACPAFADLTAPIENHPNGIVDGTQASPVDPTCQQPTLEGYSGTSTFTAIWNPVWHTINLLEDDYDASNNNTGLGDPSYNAAPSPLYSVQGDTNVYQTKTGNAGSETFSNPIAAQSTVLTTSVPKGRTVNYTLNANVPSGAGTATLPTVTGQEMTFKGFYNTADSSAQNLTQYITAAGVLTSDGSSAASSATTDSNWYAQYNCATPIWTGGVDDESTSEILEHLPTLAGYNFLGWTLTDSENDTNYVTLGCIEEDTPLYAQWQAAGFTITYNCGMPTGTVSTAAQMAGPTTASQNVTMNGGYTLAGADNCSLPGYTFAGWDCPSLPGTPTLPEGENVTHTYFGPGATGTYSYAGNVTCTAQWTPNKIDLVWEVEGGSFASGESATFTGTGSGTSCTFDGGIQIPTTPTKTGYEFGGWQVENN